MPITTDGTGAAADTAEAAEREPGETLEQVRADRTMLIRALADACAVIRRQQAE